MPTDNFTRHTAALRALGGQRVWSLMISLFGDLARDQGQAIDGPVLSAIMQGLDVKPEAARVALHRLRKDGWLVSEKSGRISRHSLTVEGRAQSKAASPRIYADPTKSLDSWQIIVTASADINPKSGSFVQIAPRTFVGPLSAAVPENALAFQGNIVPAWLTTQAQPEELTAGYAELLTTLTALQKHLPDPQAMHPVNTAILRCLIVHNWRRLVLKHPALPAPLVDPAWPGHQCHIAVWDMLGRFPRPALAALEKHRAVA